MIGAGSPTPGVPLTMMGRIEEGVGGTYKVTRHGEVLVALAVLVTTGSKANAFLYYK